MKKSILAGMLITVIFICIPLLAGLIFGRDEEEEEPGPGKIAVPETISVWLEDEQEIQELDFEEYVTCVVACEMPSDFDEEALKAQSVAARTYAMSKIILSLIHI